MCDTKHTQVNIFLLVQLLLSTNSFIYELTNQTEMIFIILLYILDACVGRLVINSVSELFLSDGTTPDYRVLSLADKINSTLRQSEICPDVEEEHQFYEYFISHDASEDDEERRVLEAVTLIDMTAVTRSVTNQEELWITGQVTLR